jgi:hypothetical protein
MARSFRYAHFYADNSFHHAFGSRLRKGARREYRKRQEQNENLPNALSDPVPGRNRAKHFVFS